MVRDGVAFIEIDQVATERGLQGNPYREFLRVPSMSAGLYVLPAGAADAQLPHKQDELYYVIRGKARMHAGSQDRAIGCGSVLFVAANIEHRFHRIEEELEILVIFAPAETE
ncbi:MAG: cupin domain-containing protein [Steroidobacteraceae bacterium]|jgi:mannose-6-phosphate isomerase-like protein (cupin superfamily)